MSKMSCYFHPCFLSKGWVGHPCPMMDAWDQWAVIWTTLRGPCLLKWQFSRIGNAWCSDCWLLDGISWSWCRNWRAFAFYHNVPCWCIRRIPALLEHLRLNSSSFSLLAQAYWGSSNWTIDESMVILPPHRLATQQVRLCYFSRPTYCLACPCSLLLLR